VHLVAALPATLAGIGLLLLPGLGFLLWLSRDERRALSLDEKLFLVPAFSVAWASWVGLVLAEASRFSLVAAGAVGGGAGALLAIGGLWRKRRAGRRAADGSVLIDEAAWRMRRFARHNRQPSWATWLPSVVLLALALGLQTRPSEYIVGGRDPGTYVAAMGLIARTGGIVYTDPLLASLPPEDAGLFFRNPDKPDFSWSRFMGFPLENPRSGRVFPEFFHLFPVFGAFLFQAMGVKAALAAPCVFGVLGTLACFLALKRILGLAPASVGAGLLAANVLQVWFARFPVSEPMSQFLIWSGLLALAHWEWTQARWAGLLAGAAFGLSLFVRVDSALIIVPIGLYVLLRRVRGDIRWHELATVLVPFGLFVAHAALHARLWAWKYTQAILTRRYWQHPPHEWVLVIAAGIAVLYSAQPLGRLAMPLWLRHRRRLLAAFVLLIVLSALYAYFLRPALSAWAGGDNNDRSAALGPSMSRSALESAGFRRLAAQDAQAFLRFGWFVHPLGLALAVAGVAGLLIRCRRRHLFLLLCALSFSAFYFYKLRVWHDYFFAARRFLPVILPSALGFAAWAVVWWARKGRWQRTTSALMMTTLAGLFVRDTARIVSHVDWQGTVRFVAEQASLLGPNSVVIFEQQENLHLLSLPLWALHGAPILELARWNPDPALLDHAVRTWRRSGREVYFVYTYRGERGLCGLFLQHLRDVAFGTKEWERNYAGPPKQAAPRVFRFKVARVVLPEEVRVPPLSELDVGGSDEFQISGFFDREGGASRTYRWTGPCATLLLPTLAEARAVVFVASVGHRPTPARVDVSLGEMSVGSFVAGSDWTEQRLVLPAQRSATNLLRLSVSTWRPENVSPGSEDGRDLGVMIDRVWLESARPGAARR
jgi:hypothetical protein